jgi:hypothetical protein
VYEILDSSKNDVDFGVSMPIFPPSFDNSCVISMDEETAARVRLSGESIYEELEPHCLCPSDVSFTIEGFPTWYESPRSPTTSNDDAYTNS